MMATYKLNPEHNGIEIYFETKPPETVLQELRNGGWRWHSAKKCWFRKRTPEALQTANKLCGNTDNPQLQEREKLYGELDSIQKGWESTLFGYKTQYGNWKTRTELDRYSLPDLQRFVEKEKKRHLIRNMPKEYCDYFGLDRKARESMALEEIEARVKLAEEYDTYVKMLFDEISAEAAHLLELTKPTFEQRCRKINEKKRQEALLAERQKEQLALKKIQSLQKGERICRKCGRVFRGATALCPECQRYVGLDAELKKLGLKLSSFWKNLRVMGGSEIPVGISDDRVAKYAKYTKGPDFQKELEHLNALEYMLIGDVEEYDDLEPSESDVMNAIKEHYREESKILVEKNALDEIVSDECLFTQVTVCLFLAGREYECMRYVQQYCLRLFDDNLKK